AYVSATGCRKEYVWETDSMTGNNWSKVPTTIIEMGYMSNPSEDRRMQQSSYQKKMVRGIANGIENYLIK
ncbi:MAG: N-acetylmuramoyl-L-alanine amidase, partial [Ruminococcus sp.]|nr:N-acetylmuramoyl-L-alanine amidase [Ruminococcus sp.]